MNNIYAHILYLYRVWYIGAVEATCRADQFCSTLVGSSIEIIPNELARPGCCDLGFPAYTVDGEEGCTKCPSECMRSYYR